MLQINQTGPVATPPITPQPRPTALLAPSISGRKVASNAAMVAGAAGPVKIPATKITLCPTKCVKTG